jgi:hypothetical protein
MTVKLSCRLSSMKIWMRLTLSNLTTITKKNETLVVSEEQKKIKVSGMTRPPSKLLLMSAATAVPAFQ